MTATPTTANHVAAPQPPPRIPDHELIRRIGRGAYGEVWLARSVTGAFRAVKIVHRSSFDRDRPFQREFEGIQKFEPISRQHESQVDILHVGRGEEYFYYVMELADDQATGGQIHPDQYAPRTLKSDLAFHTRLPFEKSVAIGIALTTALQHLHESGLVHRDVKPSNIIFVNGVAKLADIGLVTGVDTTRSYVGTEGFAAPEGPGTPQADLYSLGKVLYEISTGRDRQEFPELPTELRELPDRDGLMELNAVIARACRHDPKDRYPSAAAMRAELELLQGGKSLARLHRTERQLKFARHAGALVTVLALVIAAGWFWQARQTAIISDLASEKKQLAESLAASEVAQRLRLARMNISNGVRTLDGGDAGGALLWFAEALPLLKDHPAVEAVHRVRIQQTLQLTPTVLQVTPLPIHAPEFAAFSPDHRRIAIGAENPSRVRLVEVGSGDLHWEVPSPTNGVWQLGFTPDGSTLLISSLPGYGFIRDNPSPTDVVVILDVQTGRPRFSLTATNLVRANLSPDSQLLLTSSTDNELSLWNLETGEMLRRLEAHTSPIILITFSEDGRVAATSSRDRTVRLWRLPEGDPIGEPLQFSEECGPVTLNGDGTLLATSGGNPGIVEVWDVGTGQRLGEPIEVGEHIGGLAFLPAKEPLLLILATKGESSVVEIVDVRSQDRITSIIPSEQPIYYWTVSSDGSLVALGTRSGWIGVWEVPTGEQRLATWLPAGAVQEMTFAPGGSDLHVVGEDGLRLLRLPPKIRELHLATELGRWGPDVRRRLSAERRTLLCPDGHGGFVLLDLEHMHEWTVPRPDDPAARSGWFSIDPAGRQVAIAYQSGLDENHHFMELWRLGADATNRLVIDLPAAIRGFMEFSSDGTQVTAVTYDRQIRTWKTEDGSLERVVPSPPGFEDSLDLIADSQRVFAVFESRTFALASLDGAPTVTLDIGPLHLTKRIFDKGNRMALVAENTHWTQVLDLATGQTLTPRLDHGGMLNWADFSPDGTRLLTAGFTPELRIWDLATASQTVPPLRLGTQSLGIGLWSLDGRFVVARSDENLVRVWDAATGEAVTPIFKHEGYVRYAILGQRNQLFTVCLPGRLRAWDLTETTVAADVLSDHAKLVSGRQINKVEALDAITAEQLREICLSLQRRAPFSSPAGTSVGSRPAIVRRPSGT
jgi:WD40 repeat protein